MNAHALARRLSSVLDKRGETLPIHIESERIVLEGDPDVEDLEHIYDTLFVPVPTVGMLSDEHQVPRRRVMISPQSPG